MRLSRQARIHRAEIEEAFLCSQDDKGIARHFRVPLYEIMALRMVHDRLHEAAVRRIPSEQFQWLVLVSLVFLLAALWVGAGAGDRRTP